MAAVLSETVAVTDSIVFPSHFIRKQERGPHLAWGQQRPLHSLLRDLCERHPLHIAPPEQPVPLFRGGGGKGWQASSLCSRKRTDDAL